MGREKFRLLLSGKKINIDVIKDISTKVSEKYRKIYDNLNLL